MSIGRYRSICMRGSCELSAKSGEIVFGKVVAMAAGLSHGSGRWVRRTASSKSWSGGTVIVYRTDPQRQPPEMVLGLSLEAIGSSWSLYRLPINRKRD